MAKSNLIVLSISTAVALLGCGGSGGDSRPRTAPLLPVPYQDALCSEYDAGGEGTVDYVYNYNYDDDGFVTDYTGTGSFTATFEYDDDHFLLRYFYGVPGATGFEGEDKYTRDDFGRVLTYEGRDESRSPANTTISNETYTYDDQGRTLKSVTTFNDGVNPPDTTTTEYVYEGSSIQPSSATITFDGGMTKITYTSPNDQTLHGDIDFDADGTIDRIFDQTYNDDLQILTSIVKEQGAVIQRSAWTYDSHGLVLTNIEAAQEGGTEEYRWIATRNSDGMAQKIDASNTIPGLEFHDIEVYKDACTTPPTALVAPRPVKLRPRGLDGQVVRLRALSDVGRRASN